MSGLFIADYAVWALLIIGGRTVTYSRDVNMSLPRVVNLCVVWRVVSLAIIPLLLFLLFLQTFEYFENTKDVLPKK